MSIFVAETLGTFLLILLGNGVVAANILKDTKCGFNPAASWMVITTGWAFAVFVGVVVSANASGAHLNPVVTISLALANKLSWNLVPEYFAGEFLGAALGALCVWIMYKNHFDKTEDEATKRACFCTEPAIRDFKSNFFSEMIGAFVLMITIFYIDGGSIEIANDPNAKIGLGSVGALPVACLIWAIGLSLGATTGYAINPARDLSPRIILSLLPMNVKADWSYALIPIIAPIVGGVLATFLYLHI